MKILNKNVVVFLLSCFCVLSINLKVNSKSILSIASEVVADVSYSRPSSAGKNDATITVNIKKGFGPYKIIAVSNTTLGTISKEGDSIITLDKLVAGFYKVYIIDGKKNTTEYQVTIE